MGIDMQLLTIFLEFRRAKSNDGGSSAVLLSPDVKVGILRIIPALVDRC